MFDTNCPILDLVGTVWMSADFNERTMFDAYATIDYVVGTAGGMGAEGDFLFAWSFCSD